MKLHSTGVPTPRSAAGGLKSSNPRQVITEEFSTEASPEEKLWLALNYAVLAPSSHNTQPWRFHLHGEHVDLYRDHRRTLPVVDPAQRELTISCGAALLQLRLALHYFGHAPRIELLPDPTQADFLARVHIGLHAETDSETVVLMQAIPTRHTNRQRFRDEAVPSVALAELQNAVEKEGAALQTIEDQETRWALANLVAEADRRQWADKPFRQELAAWVRPDQSPNNDGLSVASQDLGTLMSHAGPFMIRTFDLGKGHAAKDREIALYSPLLAVLITPQDDPAAWLTVGQALGRFLLRAEVEGLSTSFLNQPIEIPELRDQLRQTLSCSGMPQLLLRVGYSAPGRLTPRRPVREVLFTPPPQLREEELQ